ncbi:hypothetical protein MF625_001054 [Paenibacillus polymyxa]|uniref:hypothetical protein n=1 Tax=Paenibacillus polymyxa TaxID=1406 RepID=UPI002024A1E7|nr:hypothetical protein [Paenibacillus polymyxa]URJ36635.1 hypothetical protein MF625_001054 [Paenibacillus polymyxa]
MDKVLLGAFEKLQKREHLLRVTRDQMGLGRITKEEFKEREAKILERYSLTDAEQRTYDSHLRMTRKLRG